jgi:hypothetical protein
MKRKKIKAVKKKKCKQTNWISILEKITKLDKKDQTLSDDFQLE